MRTRVMGDGWTGSTLMLGKQYLEPCSGRLYCFGVKEARLVDGYFERKDGWRFGGLAAGLKEGVAPISFTTVRTKVDFSFLEIRHKANIQWNTKKIGTPEQLCVHENETRETDDSELYTDSPAIRLGQGCLSHPCGQFHRSRQGRDASPPPRLCHGRHPMGPSFPLVRLGPNT